ncbi:MAG: isocitrate lyase/phosphoenolpyruvate mutase family protein [Pseudomonadota bacterium]
MPSQKDKAAQFAALHQTGCFVMPNAWDPGSARLVESLGAKAIATTGAGFAFAQAQPDLVPDRDELLANAQAIVETTSLPVSADLQDGFGETPEAVADTIRAAASVGLVGASIEA